MKMREVVIKVPEDLLERAKKARSNEMDMHYLTGAVLDGVVLPEGHGKLIDITNLPEEDKNITFTARLGTDRSFYLPQTMESFLMSLPEVVEADNEETEEFELD